MRPDREALSLLHRLHTRVFEVAPVRAVLDAAFVDLAEQLRAGEDPPHATCVVPIELFTQGAPDMAEQVRLCRAFLLRAGARMAVPEIHRNSIQRLVSYRGSGRIHQAVARGDPEDLRPRAIRSPGRATDLERHWDIVPAGVWHFPEADAEADWATVTFHSAAEEEILDELWSERPTTGAHCDQP